MSCELLVTDAGPLIALAVAAVLPLVLKRFKLTVPQAVLDECVNDAFAPGATQIAQTLKSVKPPRLIIIPSERLLPLDEAYSKGLGSGEVAVLSYAAQHQLTALVDDRRARRVAGRLKVPVVGSGAILLALKSQGLLVSIAPALAAWAKHGYFVSPQLTAELLARAGEVKPALPAAGPAPPN